MSELGKIILKDGNPILRKKVIPLDVNNISLHDQELINKMVKYIDICYAGKENELEIKPGIAIAANQVGLDKSVIYIHFKEKEIEYKYLLANSKIVSKSYGKCFLSAGEGCLSIDDDKYEGYVPRNKTIIVEAYDLINKKMITITATGILSICLQHEIDHLYGIMFYDHIDKNKPFFKKEEWKEI